MHRGIHAGVVVAPLIIGLGFLLFAVFTEYWTSLDFSQIKKYDRNNINNNNNNNASDQIIKYRNKMYYLKRHRIEFPKYTSLFGECNEYKLVEILEPVPSNIQVDSNQDSGSAPANTEPTVSSTSSTTSLNLVINDPVMEASFLKQDENCLTREQCQAQFPDQANSDLSCFCCSKPSSRLQQQHEQEQLEQSFLNDADKEESKLFKKSPLLEQCCYPNSKGCDVYHDCMDKSTDELSDCPSRKLYYSTQSHDFKHGCLRNQYNIWQFMVKTCNKPNEFYKMFKSHNYSVKIFLMRLMTLAGFSLCILFTLLSLITMLFVICCRNLSHRKNVYNRCAPTSAVHTSASMGERLNRNELNCAGGGVGTMMDLDLADDDLDDENTSRIRNCCRCNCLLCPFAFFTVFSWLSFLSFTFAFCMYMTCLSYVRQSYLIYDSEYVPMYITSAYQHNPWLFNVQQFGVSFYAMIVAYVLYIVVVVN